MRTAIRGIAGTAARLASALLLALPTACAQHAAPSPRPGSDRDAHGCIGSAGYRWCGKEQHCIRSWELASAAGITATEAAVTAYCNAAP